MAGISVNFYKITFSKITCLVPSSGIDRETAQQIVQKTQAAAAALNDQAQDEMGDDGNSGLAIAVLAYASTSLITQAIINADSLIRKTSMPDQFYISWTEDIQNPKPPYDYTDITDIVYYPQRGVSPKSGNWISLGPGSSYDCSQPVFVSQQPGAVVFWDYDGVSGDDPLWVFTLDDAHCGTFDMVLYNAKTDSQYEVAWTLEHITSL